MPLNNNRIFTGLLACMLGIACFSAKAVNPTDFTLESVPEGSTFQWSKQRDKIVALHFLLKTECPFCLKYTHDYAALAEQDRAVVHVFIKPDSEDAIKLWAGKVDKSGLKNLPLIHRDPEARLAEEFSIPGGYQFHGQSVHYPALVVLDQKGKELFRHVGKSNSDRLPAKEFAQKLLDSQAK